MARAASLAAAPQAPSDAAQRTTKNAQIAHHIRRRGRLLGRHFFSWKCTGSRSIASSNFYNGLGNRGLFQERQHPGLIRARSSQFWSLAPPKPRFLSYTLSALSSTISPLRRLQLSSSLSAPRLVSRPASAVIAGVSTSPACTPRPAPSTSLIASSHFPLTHAHVAFAIKIKTNVVVRRPTVRTEVLYARLRWSTTLSEDG
jgi:hypothetical protein